MILRVKKEKTSSGSAGAARGGSTRPDERKSVPEGQHVGRKLKRKEVLKNSH
jgi:hypothetical protein